MNIDIAAVGRVATKAAMKHLAAPVQRPDVLVDGMLVEV